MFQVSIYYNFAKNPSSFNAANFNFCWKFCASAFWILNNSHLKLQPSSRTQCAPSQRKYLFILRSNQVNQASSLARIWHGCFDIGNWSKRVTEYKLRYTISKISHSVIISKGWQPCRFKTSSVLVSKKCLNRVFFPLWIFNYFLPQRRNHCYCNLWLCKHFVTVQFWWKMSDDFLRGAFEETNSI